MDTVNEGISWIYHLPNIGRGERFMIEQWLNAMENARKSTDRKAVSWQLLADTHSRYLLNHIKGFWSDEEIQQAKQTQRSQDW